ncbi:pheST operon leader peptide PheM [Yersinia pekkanenii]
MNTVTFRFFFYFSA